MPRSESWTTERPVGPGWYWYRSPGGDESGVWIEQLIADDDGRLLCLEHDRGWVDLPGDGEWAGPIPEPKQVSLARTYAPK